MFKNILGLLVLSTCFVGGVHAQSFTDIPENSQYYNAAEFLKEKGVINGYSDGSFKPYNSINRAEFTKIVLNSQYSSAEILRDVPVSNDSIASNPFPDVNRFEWYAHYLWSAKNKGIINGYSDGNFKPSNNINLAEASKIIVNTLLKYRSIASEGVCKGVKIEQILNNEKIDKCDIKGIYGSHWSDIYINLLNIYSYEGKYILRELVTNFKENWNFPIKRGEMIQIIYEIKKIQNPKVSYDVISDSDAVKNWNLYTNNTLNIQFKYPENWIIEEEINGYDNEIYISSEKNNNYSIGEYPDTYLGSRISYYSSSSEVYRSNVYKDKFKISEYPYNPDSERSGVGPFLKASWKTKDFLFIIRTQDSDNKEKNIKNVTFVKNILSTIGNLNKTPENSSQNLNKEMYLSLKNNYSPHIIKVPFLEISKQTRIKSINDTVSFEFKKVDTFPVCSTLKNYSFYKDLCKSHGTSHGMSKSYSINKYYLTVGTSTVEISTHFKNPIISGAEDGYSIERWKKEINEVAVLENELDEFVFNMTHL